MNSTRTHSRPSLRSLPGDLFELLGSMRFAVSLLMFICVASLVGTVLQQNRSSNNYIDQFGPFWFEVFDKFSIWHVYNSWWFLLIMGFLVVSTSVCLIRNAPKMLRDARSFREHVREGSLRAFPHRVETTEPTGVPQTVTGLKALLGRMGYAVRVREAQDGVLLAAKKGSANRLGYVFAHAAMVIICIGGLLDSELPVRLQVMFGGKQPIVENMLISEVPESGRLSVNNPSFRASVLVPEGGQASTAVVMVGDGALVQPMPFTLKLKKFIVDYYSTGMPSRFASEVEVTDPDTGKTFDSTIEVNEPLRFKGMTVYQSSFDDGGSTVVLKGYPLVGVNDATFSVDGTVGKTSELTAQTAKGPRSMGIEVTAMRPINVEDLTRGDPKGADQSFAEHVASVAGSAAGKKNENLRNVGPSVEYKLIDDAGQAHEFQNYMLPVELDGAAVFLAGVRNNAGEPFRYLRIPADDDSSIAEFMRLRATLADPAARKEAARRFAERNSPSGADRQPLETAAERALDTFAAGGLQAVAAFLQANTPAADLERAADVVIRLIGASMNELRAIARERAGQQPVAVDGPEGERAAVWSRLAVAALSDLTVYPAPVFLSLADFNHVQASVFQVSRTPGKNTVYLGSLLLVLGVFSMFYIRDRRVWIWVKPQDGGSSVLAAMTSQKRTLDFNQEFERFKQALLRQKKGS
ncbi:MULTISPECIES: cytochrome c biogenesis protein ResB [Achromobacter]|uniref:Cytochrome c biogenesis protein Ccs1 n=1 Tax=Achromobacter mucicolens TaxID=1389922 RepID=A0ABM8L6B0_9BURK|nr:MULTISPECIES: cytochrome c biogenesis protein ResB [Achromobacter]MCP2514247.1 cytochrome c biogenesis protein ResB [Achromobacter mucicolens]MDH1521445.1 cytochrome c biogenesis protein ResB [Achromobacter mucicolens]CAB3815426.1 Cytochrome c biogenesis protein Ccs1 [Achromobacter mucicolens]